MLRCIAIDDEPLALELLEDNIRKVPFLELVATFEQPLQALTLLRRENIDLVFIDIQMPGINGLQFISNAPTGCMFILITAFEKYALEGYNLNVIDYLVKPVEFDRFLRACGRALELFQLRNPTGSISKTPYDIFFVNVEYSLVKIFFRDVVYIESVKDYIKIHLQKTAHPILTRKSMAAMEEQLPATDFVRIHKSYIVSVSAIGLVRKSMVVIGDTELPIGESYREKFFKRITAAE